LPCVTLVGNVQNYYHSPANDYESIADFQV
jgi:hypothetical protein